LGFSQYMTGCASQGIDFPASVLIQTISALHDLHFAIFFSP